MAAVDLVSLPSHLGKLQIYIISDLNLTIFYIANSRRKTQSDINF